jgi:hypothetical protein
VSSKQGKTVRQNQPTQKYLIENPKLNSLNQPKWTKLNKTFPIQNPKENFFIVLPKKLFPSD